MRIATPDREIGREIGGTNFGAHMNELYKYDVDIRTDTRLVSVRRVDNKLVAIISNTYSGRTTEYSVDQIIGENGTLPNDEVYWDIKPLSTNLGEIDLRALSDARPQTLVNNPHGKFCLYRIGDAWASRNLHAAMLDAARIAHTL